MEAHAGLDDLTSNRQSLWGDTAGTTLAVDIGVLRERQGKAGQGHQGGAVQLSGRRSDTGVRSVWSQCPGTKCYLRTRSFSGSGCPGAWENDVG
jgi:hypothetical protein